MGEIIATDYIERWSCGTHFTILYLNFYVWSFYAFLHLACTRSLGMLDSSTYINSSFGVFTFIIGGRLSLQAFIPSQLGAFATAHISILACIGKVFDIVFIKSTRDFLLYNLNTVSALSFIREHFFSLYLLSHYSTLLDPMGTPAQSSCSLVQFLFTRFLSIPCLYLIVAHPVTTPIRVKIGCQSLSHIVFLFHYQGLHQFYSWEIIVTESSFFGEITAPSDPWTYGTQVFLCAFILLVFNYFITNYYIYENSTI